MACCEACTYKLAIFFRRRLLLKLIIVMQLSLFFFCHFSVTDLNVFEMTEKKCQQPTCLMEFKCKCNFHFVLVYTKFVAFEQF